MDKAKLSKLRHDGHITDAEYREMIRMCDRDQEIIRKFREYQETSKRGGAAHEKVYTHYTLHLFRPVFGIPLDWLEKREERKNGTKG